MHLQRLRVWAGLTLALIRFSQFPCAGIVCLSIKWYLLNNFSRATTSAGGTPFLYKPMCHHVTVTGHLLTPASVAWSGLCTSAREAQVECGSLFLVQPSQKKKLRKLDFPIEEKQVSHCKWVDCCGCCSAQIHLADQRQRSAWQRLRCSFELLRMSGRLLRNCATEIEQQCWTFRSEIASYCNSRTES